MLLPNICRWPSAPTSSVRHRELVFLSYPIVKKKKVAKGHAQMDTEYIDSACGAESSFVVFVFGVLCFLLSCGFMVSASSVFSSLKVCNLCVHFFSYSS